MSNSSGAINLKNPNLDAMNSDYLYHIDINIPDTKNTSDIEARFGDVKFICMGGTKKRMNDLAKYLINHVLFEYNTEELVDLSSSSNRYSVFKVGPVVCCSHGVGMSSMGVILHELLKLVHYAKCHDPVFIRIGTSGGIGVEPGTVVITKDAYNGYLRNEHEIAILGNRIVRPAKFDVNLTQQLLKCAPGNANYQVLVGNTMAAECFYEGQGRLDGASCNYTEHDKISFIQQCYEKGIHNIEMEATMFSSLTLHLGVKAADICVTLINRLQGDQISISNEEKHKFEERPFHIVGALIAKALNNN